DVLAGVGGANSGLLLFSGGGSGLKAIRRWSLPEGPSALSVGEFDGPPEPDVALLTGGRVFIVSLQREEAARPADPDDAVQEITLGPGVSAESLVSGSFTAPPGRPRALAALTSSGAVAL